MRRIVLAALSGAALATAPAFGAGGSPDPGTTPTGTAPTTTAPTPAPKAFYTKLSNRTTFTRWAYTNLPDKVRKSPSNSSKSVGKLHFNTEDGPPEIYLALQMYTDKKGNQWVQTQLPGRPNGRIGWVPREGLGEFHLIHVELVVNRRALKATLFKNGKKIFQAPVGVGKSSTPTPGGAYWIREKLKGFGPVYGPLAFGTGAYSNKLTDWPGGGVVGVHGTNEPNLVPGRPSHGCIRMHNSDILRLARLMAPGTPLLIQ